MVWPRAGSDRIQEPTGLSVELGVTRLEHEGNRIEPILIRNGATLIDATIALKEGGPILSGLSSTTPSHGKTSPPPPRRTRNRILSSTAFRLPASLLPPPRCQWSFISEAPTPPRRCNQSGCSMHFTSRAAGSCVKL